MVLPANINTLEKKKFLEDGEGNVTVRTTAKGEFKLTGLNVGGRITEVEINDSTWTPLPEDALENRNAISIQNRSGIEIKLNYDDSVESYSGIIVDNGSERFYDITDTIPIYAKSQSGTVIINVEEIA